MTRRHLLKRMFQVGVFVGFSQTLLSVAAKAAEKCKAAILIDMSGKSKNPKNAEAVTIAKNLEYVEDVDKAIKAGTAKPKTKGENCGNCIQYNVTGSDCGRCNMIPTEGMNVHANGWCKYWVKKPS